MSPQQAKRQRIDDLLRADVNSQRTVGMVNASLSTVNIQRREKFR